MDALSEIEADLCSRMSAVLDNEENAKFLLGPQVCDQCDREGYERSFCITCAAVFCTDCWSMQLPHKKRNIPGQVPHEKSGYNFVELRSTLEGQQKIMIMIWQALMDDDPRKWDDIIGSALSEPPKTDNIATILHSSETPAVVVKWVYLDLKRSVQSPFSEFQMQKWFASGYLHRNLRVRRVDSTVYETLSELIERTSDSETPFLWQKTQQVKSEYRLKSSNRIGQPAPPGLGGLPVLDAKRRDTLQEKLLAEQQNIVYNDQAAFLNEEQQQSLRESLEDDDTK